MSTLFQNRLVGTIIVAAVVIIFLPDVLDGEKKSNQAEFEAIPKAEVFSGKLTNNPFPEDRLIRQKVTPVVNETALDEHVDDKSDSASALKVKKDIVVTKVDTVKKKPKPKAKVNIVTKKSSTLPEKAVAKEAWVIHLGSFKNKDNIKQLLKKLKANGYIAFTKPIKTKKGTLTKVMIGPELIKSAMVKKLPSLKKLTGIQGKVAYFEANK